MNSELKNMFTGIGVAAVVAGAVEIVATVLNEGAQVITDVGVAVMAVSAFFAIPAVVMYAFQWLGHWWARRPMGPIAGWRWERRRQRILRSPEYRERHPEG